MIETRNHLDESIKSTSDQDLDLERDITNAIVQGQDPDPETADEEDHRMSMTDAVDLQRIMKDVINIISIAIIVIMRTTVIIGRIDLLKM